MNDDYTQQLRTYTPPPEPKKKRPVFRWIVGGGLAVLFLLIVIVTVSACSPTVVKKAAAAKPATTSAPAPTTPVTTTPPPAAPSPPTSGPLGTTFTVSSTDNNGNATTYDITAVKVDQRSALSPYDSLNNPADHLTAVEFKITGDTGQSSDDANSDASAIGTDTTQYTSVFNTTPDGGNFNSGEFAVSPGETVSGWVTFELPPSQTIASVQWTPSILASSHATWTV